MSTVFSMGALEVPAERTSLTILDRTVSSPTFSARMRTTFPRLTVALVTASPTPTSTGKLSPVTADLSANVLPSTITPSAGKLSPCFTTAISPTASSRSGMTKSSPARSTVTVSGASRSSFSTSSPVFFLERASSHLPSVTKVRIIAADSKKSP